MDILSDIIANKKSEIIAKKRSLQIDDLVQKRSAGSRDFINAVKTSGFSLIAEIKRMSPSAGVIVKDFDLSKLAKTYGSSGADAISILTDAKFFGGEDGDLELAKKACGLPALRKEFIIDEFQVYESYHLGADAILLIARLLDPGVLRDFMNLAAKLDMASLVEVHDEEDLSRAIETGAGMIGVNNRDLKTFNVDIGVSLRLSGSIPDSCIAISESGIRCFDDTRRLCDAGFDGALVGTALLRAQDASRKLRELKGLG